jgi:cation diffusion facilitator CzcD-associated flavoprotein CzcO
MIQLSDGSMVTTQFFLPNTGFAAKRYMPDWPGVEDFKGTLLHSSYWPVNDLDLKHRKIAIIGTGSTGVQIFQELAPNAASIVLFQRTPNLALPMKQVEYTGKPPSVQLKDKYAELFKGRQDSFGGFDYNFSALKTFEHTPEQRREFYEELWAHGDFHFWIASYIDMLFEDNANTEAYNFWYVSGALLP